MQKIFLCLLALSLCLIPLPVNAAEEYARAETDDVGFYKTPTATDSEILFYV